MNYPLITKLFERRQFNESERTTMRELYRQTEMLAERMAATLPECDLVLAAIYKLKAALALCETAVALNPKADTQLGLPFSNGAPAEKSPFGQAAEKKSVAHERAAQLEREAKELMNQAAYMRR